MSMLSLFKETRWGHVAESIKRKGVSAASCYSELEMRKYVKAEECLNMSFNAQPANPISKGTRSTTTGCQSTEPSC